MQTIDEYISKLDSVRASELIRIRKIIHDTTPDISEVISYGMPVFKYKGKYLIGMAAFKDHMSLFPGAQPIEIMSDKLNDYKTSKGTVQFSVENKLADDLIKEIIILSKNIIDSN